MLERQETQVSLQDAGGLLGPPDEHTMTPAVFAGQQDHPAARRPYGSAPASGNAWSEEIELEDVGGLLSRERTLDRTAVYCT